MADDETVQQTAARVAREALVRDDPDRLAESVVVTPEMIERCPAHSVRGSHYRADGTCGHIARSGDER